VVASALQAGAQTLYSEDMHHGLEIQGLLIQNPFLASA
jgi:predicted nucleic acid-binding protein